MSYEKFTATFLGFFLLSGFVVFSAIFLYKYENNMGSIGLHILAIGFWLSICLINFILSMLVFFFFRNSSKNKIDFIIGVIQFVCGALIFSSLILIGFLD